MAPRASFVAACVVAAALLTSCGGGDAGSRPASGEEPRTRTRPPVQVGGGAGSAGRMPASYVREVNARCRRAPRPEATSGPSVLARRAAQVRSERRHLERLLRTLRRMRTPAAARRSIQRYRTALTDEIFLARRIERAAGAQDAQSVEIGLRQNRFNRTRRTRIARSLGLSRCWYGDAGGG